MLVLLVSVAIVCAIALFVVGIRAQQTRTLDARNALCRDCKHFELDGAQSAMRLNPAFMRMTSAMTPYVSRRKVRYEDAGPCPDCDPSSNEPCTTCSGHKRLQKAIDTFPDPKVLSPNARWEEFGWCTNPKVAWDEGAPFNTRLLWNGAANCEGKVFEIRKKYA